MLWTAWLVLCAIGVLGGLVAVVRWGYVPQSYDAEQSEHVAAAWIRLLTWLTTLIGSLYFV